MRAAEAKFAAETARWNAAEGERFPKLVLDLSGGRQRVESAGTRITGNIFHLGPGFRCRSSMVARSVPASRPKARSRAARAEFERTLLSALQDVENAYLGWHTQHAALEHQTEGSQSRSVSSIAAAVCLRRDKWTPRWWPRLRRGDVSAGFADPHAGRDSRAMGCAGKSTIRPTCLIGEACWSSLRRLDSVAQGEGGEA